MNAHTKVMSVEHKALANAKTMPQIEAGDTVRVNVRIREGEKERLQAFEGVVLKTNGGGVRGTFTVRKVSYGVGVERIFPFHSPMVDSIALVTRGQVRRSRIYYLRNLSGKKARIPEASGPRGAVRAPKR